MEFVPSNYVIKNWFDFEPIYLLQLAYSFNTYGIFFEN